MALTHCRYCKGRGVVPTAYGYAKCRCVNGTQAQRDLQRRANAPIGYDPKLDPVQRALDEHNNRRGR
jgi:hypothetical protein